MANENKTIKGKTVEATKETKSKVEATPVVKEEAKKVDTNKAEVKVAEPKKVEVKKAEPKKAEVKKAEPKKAEVKKAEPKKTEAKKAEVKKTADEKTCNFYLQYAGRQFEYEDVVARCKASAAVELGKTVASVKTIDIYVKPEDKRAYYVANGKLAGSIEL